MDDPDRINQMTPRQQKYYLKQRREIQQLSADYQKATEAKHKAKTAEEVTKLTKAQREIAEKIAEVQNLILFTSMISQLGGVLGRFK